MISSAYKLCKEMMDTDYDASRLEHLSRSTSPTATTGAATTPASASSCSRASILPASNLFCYGQVESPYGSGQFIKDLRETLRARHEKVALSEIADKEAIYGSIKDFLGKGE